MTSVRPNFSFVTLLTLSKDHKTISLKNNDRQPPMQHLAVPFDLPHVSILHTVRMRSLHDGATPFLHPDVLAMGSVLPLEVVISYTRKWWDSHPRSSYDDNILEFKYEVHALADDWIVGGQKRGRFSAKASY